jgi:hypothetical protein
MDMMKVQAFFGWCTVMNGLLLIFFSMISMIGGQWIYRIHSRWFPISREAFNVSIYRFLGTMKIIVIFLNLVPYFALLIIN